MDVLTEVVGWGGAGCLLLAYALLSAGRIAAGVTFQLLNLAGSAGLLLNGAAHGAWPSAALNLVWVAIGVLALRRTPREEPTVPG
ncbi:CBU_0592 family membrane protein [Phytohabitans sp. LJ34]|uniref:CBU_0592 family membrane protein n=1 Tax=Phytohabitans sp. LJ34 TaxID=3452217 RepID=UPI003F8B6BF0